MINCVLPGTALKPDRDLVAVLLRFRNNRIALVADIKKMFLQVKLSEEDIFGEILMKMLQSRFSECLD